MNPEVDRRPFPDLDNLLFDLLLYLGSGASEVRYSVLIYNNK